MSSSLVQSVYETDATTNSVISFTISSSSSGNLIAVLVAGGPLGNSIVSITDNKGNIYLQAPGAIGTISPHDAFTDIWYFPNCPTGITTITLTFASNTNGTVCSILEISGVDLLQSSSNISSTTSTVGPNLVVTNTSSALVSIVSCSFISPTTVASPWISAGNATGNMAAYLFNPSIGMYQAVFSPSDTRNCGSGAVFSFINLSLSDSVSLVDSLSPSFSISQNLSDNVSVSDSFPQSFSIQSDFIISVSAPVIEILVNQLVPAHVKTYFKIVE